MTHKLRTLLTGIADVTDTENVDVRGISLDSRNIEDGFLFIALSGTVQDGSDFIADAVNRGAVAVLHDAGTTPNVDVAVPLLAVTDLRIQAGKIADRFYNSPSSKLTVIGVTGTNGKTTCTQLLARALNKHTRRCAVIGTLGNGFPDDLEDSGHTTPDVVLLHRLLADFHHQGAEYVCIEVSSHALDQERTSGVVFDIAVFTNLSRDHLDYHGNMENYGVAKSRLFALPGLDAAVINSDDTFGQQLLNGIHQDIKTYRYGFAEADIQITNVETVREGLRLDFKSPQGRMHFISQLYGRFNAMNLAAITAVLLHIGHSKDEVESIFSEMEPVAGRAERFTGDQALPLVVVDYAHSPDALEHILQALREHTSGVLWCVFGCGGDRDKGKRSIMGAVAEKLADHVILTDDNPRTETPQSIVKDILSGMQTTPHVEHDRKAAILYAVHAASEQDVVLVAGKGHETYQQIGDKKLPFSDRDTVKAILGEAA
ncbi:MAG: UDP-N-acetylmuramoyl-L-alanyl-D-glutamate--2,6-diaminopimelate ligase [Gammaproteobacteria bacterium]|nr:MAG: UDP-N-acetylmuramoyl-L-alanyl-D-glutamate--2,6-diaminopimelate ligase [Gammaproteobacteria bacterium]